MAPTKAKSFQTVRDTSINEAAVSKKNDLEKKNRFVNIFEFILFLTWIIVGITHTYRTT